MFTNKRVKFIFKIDVILTAFLLMIIFFPMAFSKYQTTTTGKINSNIAFYLAKTDYQVKRIKLTDLVPSDNPYVFTFDVSNYNDSNVSDVDIEYTLQVVTTTNLPLRYQLFENEDYQLNSSTNLITENNRVIARDADGTYFQTITLPKETLLYTVPKKNSYTIVVYFDESNKDSKYQDIIDSIRIIVDSRQIIDS